MKKVLISAILVLMLILSLASCSNKENKTDAENTAVPEVKDGTSILENWNAPYQYDDLSEFVVLEDSDYIGLSYTPVSFEVTDEDIQYEIQKLIEENAVYTDITDRGAENGDIVNIDYTGYMDGEAFEGGSNKGDEFVLGEANLIPGFQEGIVGHKVGETFTVDVVFPENYGNTELQNKPAQFEMTLNSLQSVSYPTLSDAFVKENTDYDSVTEYYTAINEMLIKQSEASAKVQQKNELFSTLCTNVEFLKFPEAEYNEYRNVFVSQYEQYAEMYQMTFEDFITNAAGSSVEEFNKYADDYAAESVKMELAFFAVANKLGIIEQLTMDDYNDYLVNIASEYMQTPEDFLAMYGEDAVYRSLVWDTVMDYILANAIPKN